MIEGDNEIERVGVIDGVRVADIDKLGVADIDRLGVTDGVGIPRDDDTDKLGVSDGVSDKLGVDDIDKLGVSDGVSDGVGEEGISSNKTILNPPLLFRNIISNPIFYVAFSYELLPICVLSSYA